MTEKTTKATGTRTGAGGSADDLGTSQSTTRPTLVGDTVYRTTAGLVTFLGGLSQSCAAAFGEMEQRLTPSNVTEMGFSNGLVEGVAAGNARFFEELARTSRETFDVLQRQRVSHVEVPIDYERLSKMVAREMERSQAEE